MSANASTLTEDHVIDAVCAHLEREGWLIEHKARTTDRGVDIVARLGQVVLKIEAKGATSSKPHTARHGEPFRRGVVRGHVARAFYTAAAAALEDPRPGENVLSAMALPVTPNHREFVDNIRGALERLELGVFWVEAPARVRLAAPWQAATQREGHRGGE